MTFRFDHESERYWQVCLSGQHPNIHRTVLNVTDNLMSNRLAELAKPQTTTTKRVFIFMSYIQYLRDVPAEVDNLSKIQASLNILCLFPGLGVQSRVSQYRENYPWLS